MKREADHLPPPTADVQDDGAIRPLPNISSWQCLIKKAKKAITVAGRGGPWGCETSRLSYFLLNRLTDGGEVVKPNASAAL
jgi:hypothetical protein